MSVRKLSSIFNNASNTDNNNNNHNKVVPKNTTTQQTPSTKNGSENNKPSNSSTIKPITSSNNLAQNKKPSNRNVSKFKNMFENQKDEVNVLNLVKTPKKYSIQNSANGKSISSSVSSESNKQNDTSASLVSKETSKISSGFARDNNFKALLSQKLLNPAKEANSSNSLQYNNEDNTSAIPLNTHQQDDQQNEDIQQGEYLRMDAFRFSKRSNKTNDIEARPQFVNEAPKVPHKVPKYFTPTNSNSEEGYLNTDETKVTNFGVQLNMEQQWEQLDDYKYDYAEDFSISSRVNTLEPNGQLPLVSSRNASSLLPHRSPKVPTVDSSSSSKPNSTRSQLPTHTNQILSESSTSNNGKLPFLPHKPPIVPTVDASNSSKSNSTRSQLPTHKDKILSEGSTSNKGKLSLLPHKPPVVPTVNSSDSSTINAMSNQKNQSFLLSPKKPISVDSDENTFPGVSKNETLINCPQTVGENRNKSRQPKNLGTITITSNDAPPLPPRNGSTSKSSNNSISTPLSSKLMYPDYPVFSPASTTPSSTQSIIANEINPFTFDTVNAQKHFTDELRKELFKNEQVETSNSIDVEEKISDIIYGRKGLKFSKSKDDPLLRDAVRLSYLSLQSDETIDDDYDDFDSDSDWDDSPEQIDYNRSFSTNIKLDSIPLEQILKNTHTHNLKWTEIMDKFQVNIYHLTEKERNIQDAKYELISSEWSFLKAINILYSQFVEKLFIVLSNNEKSKLFAYVKEVKDCSEKFLKTIENCWQNNLFMDNFCDVLCQNLENNFDVYVHYCSHQIYSEELLGEIVSDKTRTFYELLHDIQCDPVCNGLHLHAYQLIPIRKINNFPNLLENIMKCLTQHDREYEHCKTAMYMTKQLLHRCNTETKEAKEHIRTKTILEKLEFPKNSQLKLNQGDVHMRRMIKSDKMDMTEISSTLFGKRVSKKPVYVFLFNDIFVVARKCNANKYMVIDYCFRINLELDTNPVYLNLTIGSIDLSTILYLHIKENRELKPTEIILSCKTRTDAVRWVEALDPPETPKSGERFSFDFIRKVIVQRNYSAVHSDEINLTIGEIYTILRETEDGWSFGQREKDGECGWFQTENVLLVDDVRQRISNVKQKYKTRRQQH